MAPPRIRKVFSGFAPDLQIDLKGTVQCMCFTVISTFNLILSATGMTGRNSRKTRGFTDSYDWSLVVPLLQLWNVLNFSFLSIYLSFSATIMTDYVGHAC